MKRRAIWVGIVLAFALQLPVFAFWGVERIRPESQSDSMYQLSFKPTEGDMVSFTVTRIPSIQGEADRSELASNITALLEFDGISGTLLRCPVQINTQRENIAFEFQVSRKSISRTHLIIRELDGKRRDKDGREWPGAGGMEYQFELNDFVPRSGE